MQAWYPRLNLLSTFSRFGHEISPRSKTSKNTVFS